MSFVIEISNILLTRDTVFGIIPLQFAVVIGVFSQKGKNIHYVLTALVIGAANAIISKSIYRRLALDDENWRTSSLWKRIK